ncbi:MAG: crossover junction endodeoxyribonuclease RuvC [Planctomycetota bacterium]
MRVLGIDPGLQLTGFGCLDFDGGWEQTPRLVDAGVIRLKPGDSISSRLSVLERDLRELMEELTPQAACVEALFSHYAHPRTAVTMAHARGVILLTLQRAGVELVELPPAEVKKALTGSGRASKEQMQAAIAAVLSLPSQPEPPDVADALGVAMAGARRLHARGVAVEG